MKKKMKLLGGLLVISALTVTAMAQSDSSANPGNSVPSTQAITPTDGSAQKTPTDQGSSDNDVQITKTIRQEIVGMKGLSMDAKNVKIITKNGQVTLRGMVKSTDEQKTIGDIAVKVAGATKVKNKITVKATT